MKLSLEEVKQQIPPQWCLTTLGEISHTRNERVDPAEFPEMRFIGMDDVESETMRLIGTKPASEMKSSAEYFRPNDVLYGRLRPYLNKVYRPEFEGLCSAEFIVFRKRPFIESKYLQYFLNSWRFVRFATQLNSGDRPRVKVDQLSDYPFPLAPLTEQHRIVDEIEKQFSRLDAAETALKRLQANLERYRASVLNAAFTGQLLPQESHDESAEALLERILAERRRQWEEQEWQRLIERAKKKIAQAKRKAAGLPYYIRDLEPEDWEDIPEEEYRDYLPKNDKWKQKYEEPEGPDAEGLPELPEGWCWASIEQLSDVVRGASPRPAGDPRYFGGDIPWITVGSLTADDSPYLYSVSDFVTALGKQKSRYVEPETLLLTNSGATLGVPKITKIGGCINDGSVALRNVDYPLKIYLYYFLSSKTKELRAINQGAAQPNLNTGIVKSIKVPLAPLAQHREIVDETERLLSLTSELTSSIKVNLRRIDRLRQAILKQAFTGNLVLQDPTDEPASQLLKRIRGAKGDEQPDKQLSLFKPVKAE